MYKFNPYNRFVQGGKQLAGGRPTAGEVGYWEFFNSGLLLHNNDLTNNVWAVNLLTRTGGQADFKGGTSAILAVPTGTASYLHQTFTTVVGQLYTIRVYMKSTGSDRTLELAGYSAGLAARLSATICTVTSAWQEFSHSFTATTTTSSFLIGGNSSWSTGEDIYIAAPQAIDGATFTEYKSATHRQLVPSLTKDRKPEDVFMRGAEGAGAIVNGAYWSPYNLTGNQLSTPSTNTLATLGASTPFAVIADITLFSWGFNYQGIGGKWNGAGAANSSFALITSLANSKKLEIYLMDTAGTTRPAALSTVALPVNDGQRVQVAALVTPDYTVNNRVLIDFYYRFADTEAWVALGTQRTISFGAGTTMSQVSTSVLSAASAMGGLGATPNGLVHRFEIRQGSLTGTIVAGVSMAGTPDFATNLTGLAGAQWTVTSSAGTGSNDSSLAARGWIMGASSYGSAPNLEGRFTPFTFGKDLIGGAHLTNGGATHAQQTIGSGTFDVAVNTATQDMNGYTHNLYNPNNGFTILGWHYKEAGAHSTGFQYYGSPWSIGYDLYENATSFVRYSSDKTVNSISNEGAISTGWHCIGMRGSSASHTPLIDGIVKTTVTASVAMGTTQSPPKIGNALGSSTRVVGRTHGVCAWNRALTNTEVTEFYNGGTPLPYESWSSGLKAGCVTRYGFTNTAKATFVFAGRVGDNTGGRPLFRVRSTGANIEFLLRRNANNNSLTLYWGGASYGNRTFNGAFDSTAAETGVWFLTVDGTSLALYKNDGTLIGTNVLNGNLPLTYTTTSLFVGGDTWDSTYNSGGETHAVEIANGVVWSVSQMKNFYRYIRAKGEKYGVHYPWTGKRLFDVGFTTNKANPLSNPYIGEKGHIRSTDPATYLSAGSGVLNLSGGASAWTTNLSSVISFPRTIGRSFGAKTVPGAANGHVMVGAHSVANATIVEYGFYLNSGGVATTYDPTGNINYSVNYVGGVEYKFVTVLRAAGAYYFIKGGAFINWTLVGLTSSPTVISSNLYANIVQHSNARTFDDLRVQDLGAPFTTDYGLATDRKAGAVALNTTFTHEANSIIEFTVATMPTTGDMDLVFRNVAGPDYIRVRIKTDGVIQVFDFDSPSETTIGSGAAGSVAAGTRVVLITEGNTIRLYTSNVLKATCTSTIAQTGTTGSIVSLNGGTISDLVSYPRTITGAAATQLDLLI